MHLYDIILLDRHHCDKTITHAKSYVGSNARTVDSVYTALCSPARVRPIMHAIQFFNNTMKVIAVHAPLQYGNIIVKGNNVN